MTTPSYDIERDTEGMPVRMFWMGDGPSLKEMEMNWREACAPIIRKVIAETRSDELHLLKDRLRAAYPFGPYSNHPQKIWLDEIRRQFGKPVKQSGRKRKQSSEEQGGLFS